MEKKNRFSPFFDGASKNNPEKARARGAISGDLNRDKLKTILERSGRSAMAHRARVYTVAASAGAESSQNSPKAEVLRRQNMNARFLRGLFHQNGTRKGFFIAESSIFPAIDPLDKTATSTPIHLSKNHGKQGNPCHLSIACIQNT